MRRSWEASETKRRSRTLASSSLSSVALTVSASERSSPLVSDTGIRWPRPCAEKSAIWARIWSTGTNTRPIVYHVHQPIRKRSPASTSRVDAASPIMVGFPGSGVPAMTTAPGPHGESRSRRPKTHAQSPSDSGQYLPSIGSLPRRTSVPARDGCPRTSELAATTSPSGVTTCTHGASPGRGTIIWSGSPGRRSSTTRSTVRSEVRRSLFSVKSRTISRSRTNSRRRITADTPTVITVARPRTEDIRRAGHRLTASLCSVVTDALPVPPTPNTPCHLLRTQGRRSGGGDP